MPNSAFVKDLQLGTDPLMPVIPRVSGLVCEDHATFVVRTRDIHEFTAYWQKRLHMRGAQYLTKEFPALHVVFAKNPNEMKGCEQMIGMSTSFEPDSPINQCLNLYGSHHIDSNGDLAPGRLQHIAYSVQEDLEMTDVVGTLERAGVQFMGPVMSWTDEATGAFLKQIFVACKVPCGPFIELVQRGRGRSGEPFTGFNAGQIDSLYRAYHTYSSRLLEKMRGD